MSVPEAPPPDEPTSQQTAAMLQRILEAVERDRRNRWVEVGCAIVLSLATTTSAWCAYESTRWGGVQTFRLAAAAAASRESAAATLAALQSRAFDASMGISWMQAKHQGDPRQERFLFDRFRPEMKKAVEAWLKTDPFNDPNAPLGPLRMAEYVQPELETARRFEADAAREYAAAMHANQTSDAYVLLTVLFASVLFFGGIAGTLESRRLRVVILGIALVLFLVTIVWLAGMPVCNE